MKVTYTELILKVLTKNHKWFQWHQSLDLWIVETLLFAAEFSIKNQVNYETLQELLCLTEVTGFSSFRFNNASNCIYSPSQQNFT